MTIAIKNLNFSWNQKENNLLKIANFEVLKGEKVFIYGPSGSGKSTFLGLLGGVLTPKEGEIKILDKAINKLPAAKRDCFRADHIGFIFQQFNLLPYLNVIENVLLALPFSDRKSAKIASTGHSMEAEARRLLKALGLHDESLYKQSVQHLSVGQQQRVATARALIGSPEIIIADEPSSALDQDACQDFLELLFKECRRNQSILVFVSHDRTIAHLFDRTISIDTFKPCSI